MNDTRQRPCPGGGTTEAAAWEFAALVTAKAHIFGYARECSDGCWHAGYVA